MAEETPNAPPIAMESQAEVISPCTKVNLTPSLTSHQPKRFRLFDLPPELWAYICLLAVTFLEPIIVTDARDTHKRNYGLVTRPAVTRTCKLLRAECLHHYYQSNVFFLEERLGFLESRPWLIAIGRSNRAQLRNLWLISRDINTAMDLWFEDDRRMTMEMGQMLPPGLVNIENGNPPMPLPAIDGMEYAWRFVIGAVRVT